LPWRPLMTNGLILIRRLNFLFGRSMVLVTGMRSGGVNVPLRCSTSADVCSTIGAEARIAGPAIQAMSREFELGAGHLCDSLRCSKSPNSHLSSRRSSDADETSDWTRHPAKLRRDVWGGGRLRRQH